MKPCIIKHCDKEVSERSSFEECPTCRAMFNRWFKRPSVDVISYQHRLDKWTDRMSRLVTQPKGKKLAKAFHKRRRT